MNNLQKQSLVFHTNGKIQYHVIRYQLLTACAGALCEAVRHGYSRALVLVHEFITDKTDDKKQRRNAEDLDAFVYRLSNGDISKTEPGMIYGPFTVAGNPILSNKTNLFIGKVTREHTKFQNTDALS